jgi:uncharacterized protein (DUF2147 family)
LPAILVYLLAACPYPSVAGETNEADAIIGVWNTSGDRGKMEVFKVKNEYRAKIVSLGEPNYPEDDEKGMGGQPRVDRENPDPKLRDRKIEGLEIMTGLTYKGDSKWEGGRIYDPESGNTYRCKMTLVSTNRLQLRGFIGFSLLGRNETWTRAD